MQTFDKVDLVNGQREQLSNKRDSDYDVHGAAGVRSQRKQRFSLGPPETDPMN